MTAALASGSDADFGNVNADAAGPTGTGVYDLDAVQFVVEYSNDTKLYRDGSDINIKLGDGSAANAFLDLTGGDPTFAGPSFVDYQIPGRYLSISGMINPQQAKWTGGSGSSGDIWDNGGDVGRVPRVAGDATTGLPIYKVGDIGGSFGVGEFGSATCHVTMDNVIVAWPTSCGANDFGESGGTASHQIAYILDGSGFVEATHTIELDLQVPAGVYPGTYTGTLTVEQTFS